MGFWSNLWGNGGDKRRVGIQDPAPNPSRQVATPVTFDTAMTVSAFWACVRLLTETVAAMPLKAYKIEDGIKVPDPDNELFKLMNYRPNRYQTRTEFIEAMMLNLTTNGNSYCAIERTNTGRIISIMPLVASQMEVQLLDDGTKTYNYSTADGSMRVFAEESIWHVMLFGNSVVGLSPLGYARNALGISQALEDRETALAANGGKTTGVLMIDKVLNPEQRQKVRENFAGLQQGNDNNLFVLEAGMTYEQTSLSPADMQLIENRRFSVEEIARFMGVPSVLINDTTAATSWGSGIQQITMGFYKLNLRPYLERFESSWKRWLMPESEWENTIIEFDFDALLRADKSTRMETAGKAVNNGQLTPNEARQEEGKPPLEGGDTLYLNGTLVPAGTNQGEENGTEAQPL